MSTLSNLKVESSQRSNSKTCPRENSPTAIRSTNDDSHCTTEFYMTTECTEGDTGHDRIANKSRNDTECWQNR